MKYCFRKSIHKEYILFFGVLNEVLDEIQQVLVLESLLYTILEWS